MSARSRPPSDESSTEVFDGPQGRARNPTRKGFGPAVDTTVPTVVGKGRGKSSVERAVEISTPTHELSAGDLEVMSSRDRSSPMVAVSMKTPAERAAAERPARPEPVIGRKVQLRSLEDLGKRHKTVPGELGYLAPPRDVKEGRVRKLRDYVIWGSVAVMVACAVTLAVWFLARS